jgi:hypothetical protein
LANEVEEGRRTILVAETVNEQTILAEWHHVPQERREEVLAYIRSLHTVAPSAAGSKRAMIAADLLHSGLIGTWADRSDIGASRQFARRLREQAQSRRRAP